MRNRNGDARRRQCPGVQGAGRGEHGAGEAGGARFGNVTLAGSLEFLVHEVCLGSTATIPTHLSPARSPSSCRNVLCAFSFCPLLCWDYPIPWFRGVWRVPKAECTLWYGLFKDWIWADHRSRFHYNVTTTVVGSFCSILIVCASIVYCRVVHISSFLSLVVFSGVQQYAQAVVVPTHLCGVGERPPWWCLLPGF